jgi:hypothetical protein
MRFTASDFAAQARASRFTGSPYGGAETGLDQAQMEVLIQATTLKQRIACGEFGSKSSKMGKAAIAAEKSRLLGQLNAIDSAKGGGNWGQGRHRPLAYVPFYNKKGQLQVPNEFAIQARYNKLYRNNATKATGHALLSLFGRKHMAILGFVTRNSDKRTGQMQWTPGGMRLYATSGKRGPRGSTKAIAFYTPASGKGEIAITAKSRSRLQQLLVNTSGAAGAGIVAFRQGPAWGSAFECAIPNARALAPGERVRVIATSAGARFAITAGAKACGKMAIGLNDSALGQVRAAARARARQQSERKRRAQGAQAGGVSSLGRRLGAVGGGAVSQAPVVAAPVFIDLTQPLQAGVQTRAMRRRRDDFEAASGIAMDN